MAVTLGLPTLTLETGNDIVEEIPPFILADSAYVNIKHIITTFRTTESWQIIMSML